MKVIVMGCGRVGSAVAARLDAEGHEVTVLDVDAAAFARLPSTFGGERLTGSGFEHRRLEEAGIREADAFLALAHGDNRNILASQKAQHIYGVRHVVTRVKDPHRAEIFGQLGLRTFSPTTIGAELAHDALFAED